MTRIRLFCTAQGWMSRSDDPQVRRLFGTDTIPCAYTAAAPAEMVLAEIQRLNPGADVQILDQDDIPINDNQSAVEGSWGIA